MQDYGTSPSGLSATRIAFLTIGQAPRRDLSEPIERALPPHVQVRHAGALDGLDRATVQQQFSPGPGGAWLISKLADGQPVTLRADAIGALLQQAIDRLEEEGVDGIVLLCTGEFPGLRTRRAWLIEPDGVVCAGVDSLLRNALAGVLVPMPEQVNEARVKWQRLQRPPLFAAASPYDETPDALIDAARTLRRQGAQALVLDCMGYAPAHKAALRAAGLDIPVLVSASVLGGAVAAYV